MYLEYKKINSTLPFVSVLVPTCDRRIFIPQLLHCYYSQTYPQDRMELIIADDGQDPIHDLVEGKPGIKYLRLNEKITIGSKRNYLNDNANGDILVCMDDDDYYPPVRVAHAVEKLTNSDKLIAASSEMLIYFINKIGLFKSGPFHENHGSNATFAYKKEYLLNNRYDDTKTIAEEVSFTNNFTNLMIQLDSKSTILVIAHNTNTFDKENLIFLPSGELNPDFKKVSTAELIINEKAFEFYKNMLH
ncbi:MAG: hypothetical protein DKM50_11050 [Candidatus Margulisiibacteriota bacterium]|nr:MAG: hypothetical protein DKM50_11050 [Candidatus Margulisiibacteriota bacterium]HCY38039.1 hypothetical protein [Candidatus Margulisiibacteriota bacterium]